MKRSASAFGERRARLRDQREAEDDGAWDDSLPPELRRGDAPRPRSPATSVPWAVRVAAEAGWRFLVLAATLWVLMRVIGAVRLVVLAFVVALLVTALLQPTVARLHRHGLSRGAATALTATCGFVL
ncbi:AI-2E family transporter, partial [Streptomyces sp. NPDC056222]|uniref:AI-2E family transporter n=1 Tax=Streptomyces sp. NPDC056222 TaxID=3345749 RepID=UPI0035D531DE